VGWRWRIRHKLMVGLGLVAAVIALMLGGTVYGLAKSRAAMKGVDNKVAELTEANEFAAAIVQIEASIASDAARPDYQNRLRADFERARKHLAEYSERLKETITQGYNPNDGVDDVVRVQMLENELKRLEQAVDRKRNAASVVPNSGSQDIIQDSEVSKPIETLKLDSRDLQDGIYRVLYKRSQDSRQNFQSTLWIVSSTGIAGIVLLASLLHFFYGWMFSPIRALEEGAGQVARGEFDHRIEVNSGDELEDLAAAFNDMTGRLRDMYRDLERQVNDRSRQLVRSERLAGVGFLAAGVAHEINNPLASIAFCSEAMEGRLKAVLERAPEDNEVITRYLRMIQQEAFRCKAITQRLLEFSRGGERQREPADLVELVRGVLDMVQHLQNCRGKEIIFDTPDSLIAWVNTQEIKSVVLNLVVNALESMDQGGVLTIRAGQRGKMAELVFSDTGCGMTPNVLENIFEPFFTRSRTGKGTGLGLSISHRVISQHGGEIEATSPGLNQGSTFNVRLPMEPAEATKEELLGHAAA
jgi:signal transduction histidine kinase